MAQTLKTVKSIMKRSVPAPMMNQYQSWKLSRIRRVNAVTPLKEVFTRVYEEHQWGGEEGFCSGGGSTELHAANYATVVNQVIKHKGVTTVVDCGCGDFVVGKALRTDGVRYIGIDVVESLIKWNQKKHGDHDTSFLCKDIVKDTLPDGQLCLIRQVLQHLSNSEIATVLQKTRRYPWVIVTEHYPAASVTPRPNIDKPHGLDTRVPDDSAVYLDKPPFNVPPQSIELILDVDAQEYLKHSGERLRTYLITNGGR